MRNILPDTALASHPPVFGLLTRANIADDNIGPKGTFVWPDLLSRFQKDMLSE